jgi:hypothetical protein
VLLSVWYVAVLRVMQLIDLGFRSADDKEFEIVVLRHELAILRRQIGQSPAATRQMDVVHRDARDPASLASRSGGTALDVSGPSRSAADEPRRSRTDPPAGDRESTWVFTHRRRIVGLGITVSADAITPGKRRPAMGVGETRHPLRRSSTSCAATASRSARNRARGMAGCSDCHVSFRCGFLILFSRMPVRIRA